MARLARVVVPGMPHHIVQRGVRRIDVFLSDDDRREYLKHISAQGKRFGVKYLAWCLMSNHIHLIAIPAEETSLARGIGEAHRRYTRYINFREGSRGYLFQERFHSCTLEGSYLLAAVRYVLRNPVRAGIVDEPWEYRWSSAQWLIGLIPNDPVATRSDMLDDVVDWRAFLRDDEAKRYDIRKHTRTGRPLGGEAFLNRAEQLTGRLLHPKKRGRKPLK